MDIRTRFDHLRHRTRLILADLTPPRAFVLIAGGAALLAMLWAALVSIDVIVRTEGRIVPAGKSQIIQHLEGGIVRQILVQEGEVVKSGQALMELSDIQAKSTLGQEQTKLSALRGREVRLMAEASGAASIAFPADLNDPDVQRAETEAWRARKSKLAEETKVFRDQGEQKRGEAAEISARRHNLAAELEVARKQLNVIEGLRRNGAASELEVLEAQSRVKRLGTQIAEADAAGPRLRAAQAETESRMAEALARFRADASAELTQVRADLEKSTLEVSSSEDKLNRNIVRAPVSGFINRLAVSTVGGVVRPGETLMELTPDDQRVVLETRARPNDRANLRRGLPAKVRIGAYDYATYGAMDGVVTEVSADTIADEREGRFYRVRIEATPNPGRHSSTEMIPGLTADADIVVGKRTILSYVLSPLLRFRDGAFRDPR